MSDTIGWIAREYQGQEITDKAFNKLKNKEDLKIEMDILVPTFTGGYVIAKVKDERYAETLNFLYLLEFDIDDRHCWTCGGIANKKALEKLK